MIDTKKMACSREFSAALAAVEDGKDIRRAVWPAGMCLRKQCEQMAFIRDGQQTTSGWTGPSEADVEATDWIEL